LLIPASNFLLYLNLLGISDWVSNLTYFNLLGRLLQPRLRSCVCLLRVCFRFCGWRFKGRLFVRGLFSFYRFFIFRLSFLFLNRLYLFFTFLLFSLPHYLWFFRNQLLRVGLLIFLYQLNLFGSFSHKLQSFRNIKFLFAGFSFNNHTFTTQFFASMHRYINRIDKVRMTFFRLFRCLFHLSFWFHTWNHLRRGVFL
jgi:hypothetical protein